MSCCAVRAPDRVHPTRVGFPAGTNQVRRNVGLAAGAQLLRGETQRVSGTPWKANSSINPGEPGWTGAGTETPVAAPADAKRTVFEWPASAPVVIHPPCHLP